MGMTHTTSITTDEHNEVISVLVDRVAYWNSKYQMGLLPDESLFYLKSCTADLANYLQVRTKS